MSLLLTAAMGWLSACGAGGGPARAAVLPERGYGYDMEMAGVLNGDPETGCLWLEDPGGGREQVLLVGDFRVNWSAEPPLIEKGGRPFAELGEHFVGTGGYDDVDGVPGCPLPADDRELLLIFARSHLDPA